MHLNVKLRASVLFVLCFALVCAIPTFGQVIKGSISGSVTDPQGAVVSGAQVKATNTATGVALTTTSDSSGLFRFNLIPVGAYKVEVSAQGFKTAVQNNVAVAAGVDASVGAIKLTVGETSTTVEVAAEAPLIETTQAQVTNTFSTQTLQTFAGIQENQGLDNLALFVPGIVSVRDNSFSNTNGGQGFSSNGLRGRNNDQQIDGQNNNDNSVGGPGLFVSDTEFVQQYVLITNQFGPEYGRNAGSVVNVITKSGSNAWHGSVYENENNSVMNSMNNGERRFAVDKAGNPLTEKPRLNDEFGGFTIGGPIVKNKAFFFGGFDQEITATVANFQNTSLTPTPAGLATLATCFPGSQTLTTWNKFGPYAISAGNPTPIPVGLNATGTKKGFIPIELFDNTGTACDNVQFGGVERDLSAPFHGFNFVNRVDYQQGNDNFMARYLFNRGNNFNQDFGDAAAGYPVSVPALSQAILVGWTHNLSTRMVNELRVGFNRLNVDFGTNTIGTVPSGGNLDQGLARISFRFPSGFDCNGSALGAPCTVPLPNIGYMAIGTATNLPQFRIVNTWQAQDNWNFVMGKHTFKAGVNYTFQRSPNGFLPTVNGAYQFDGWGDTIGAGASFLSNTPNRVQVAQGASTLDFREHDTFIYGGDDWKIGKNLTVNLGLTWTYYGQPANLFHDQTVAQQSATPPVWLGSLPQSVTTFPIFPAPKNSFGPSVGFAYSPQWGGFLTGNGKTTFRGGYRLLYDPPFYNIYLNMASSAPAVFLQTFTGGSRIPTSPDATTLGMPAIPLGPNVRASLGSQLQLNAFDPRSFNDTTMDPNFGPDKVHSWSFGLERELTKNSVIEARYAGNHATDLFQSINANPVVGHYQAGTRTVRGLADDFPNLVPAGITPCPLGAVVPGPGQTQASNALGQGRLNCGQGVLRSRTNGGVSDYNAAQIEFRANNLFKQLTIRTGYTYSKNLDNVSEIFSTFGGATSVAFAQNPFNQTGERSFSGLDIPHQWTILFTEQLPFFKEQHGFMGHLLGGWSFSG
ncbi:MAG TPA: TonB-dependent receptor, partial [Candidatus Limnocylindrales bacterium]|nr:TonB-dependent receptor [Candidatus Limnocylindrales bacterium]